MPAKPRAKRPARRASLTALGMLRARSGLTAEVAELVAAKAAGLNVPADTYVASILAAWAREMTAQDAKAAGRGRLLKQESVQLYVEQLHAAVVQALGAFAPWVKLDYGKREVTVEREHSGKNEAGVAWLRIDKPEQWADLAGNVTRESVGAMLLGLPRPKGAVQ